MTEDEILSTINGPMTVGDVISRQVLCCHMATPISDAARMMCESGASSVVVIFEGAVEGIWTEADALKLSSFDRLSDQPVSSVMTHPVKQIPQTMSMEDASFEMQLSKIRHLLVVDDDGWPVGLLSQTDVVRTQGIEHDLLLRQVGSIVSEQFAVVADNMSASDAAKQMREVRANAVAVQYADGGDLGIFTERDYLRALVDGEGEQPVGQSATRPLMTVSETASLMSARKIFDEHQFRHLGVTRNDPPQLIGILSFAEIVLSVERDYINQLRDALDERDIALQTSQEHLYLAQQVIDASRDGIMVTDARGIIQSVNPAFTTITGFSAEEAIGQTPAILKSGRHDAKFYQRMWESVTLTGHWAGEVWNRRKDGQIYAEWLSINAILNDEGEMVKLAAILSDITDRKKSEERIKNLAYFDSLTGLPNRRMFHDRLTMALANAHRHNHMLAVVFLDLDLFKRINDTLGHSAGDELLRQLASRLNDCLREGDTAARMGGDEFTVLLQEIDSPDAAAMIADRISEVMSKPFVVQDNTLYVSVSIGISIYPHDGVDVETLLQNADTAMYKVKEAGRNSYQLYAAEMNEHALQALSIETSLRAALAERQFHLVYQPKTDLTGGIISGLEVLIRWDHPEMGMVSPATFIPIAERIGLIGQLGEWVLESALEQCQQWVAMGYEQMRVAVNVSAIQLTQEGFADRVFGLLDHAKLDPSHLELEITESVFMDRVDILVPLLNRLKRSGVQISIDDFGTGYSSFGYLKRLPINKLKIDISFVKELPHNHDDCQIASAIIAMAHQLNLTVVAEGVETPAQMAFLKAHGCDEVQGYLIAKPQTSDEITPLLEKGRFTFTE